MPIVLKSRNLKRLESSGPVQACNGIALPFFTDIHVRLHKILECKMKLLMKTVFETMKLGSNKAKYETLKLL